MMTSDPDSPVLLESFPSDIEAANLVGALEEFGITATATGSYTAGFRAEAPGNVCVMVKLCDLERAKQALAEFTKKPSDVDWSQVDFGEPRDT